MDVFCCVKIPVPPKFDRRMSIQSTERHVLDATGDHIPPHAFRNGDLGLPRAVRTNFHASQRKKRCCGTEKGCRMGLETPVLAAKPTYSKCMLDKRNCLMHLSSLLCTKHILHQVETHTWIPRLNPSGFYHVLLQYGTWWHRAAINR